MTTASGNGAAAGRSAVPAGAGGPSFRAWRRLAFGAQAALALGLPFLRVGGESALRLDVPSGRLHAFGASLAVDEAFVVLAATLFLTATFLLVTLLFGRAWCGWACPQTVLGELTALVGPSPGGRRRPWRRAAGFAVTAVVATIVGADLVWWFVSPYDFLSRLAHGTLGPILGWSWAMLAAVLFLDLGFLRQTFCATACPYAKLQGVLFDRHTLVVAYDARRDGDCVDCLACVRVCPTGIDIRDGLQMECIACAACVDACTPIMRRLGRAPGLVGYFHGEPGRPRRLLRPATLALGALSAAALALFVGAAWDRPSVAVTLSSEPAFVARWTSAGEVASAFDLVLESRAERPLEVSLTLLPGAPDAAARVRPDAVRLAPGEIRRLRLLTFARGLRPGRTDDGRLITEVRSEGARPERREWPLPLAVPEAP